MEWGKRNVRSSISKMAEQMRWVDMHAHLFSLTEEIEKNRSWQGVTGENELDFRKQQGVFSCISAGTPEEWQYMKKWNKRKECLFSFGIHPWYADRYSIEDCKEAFQQCDFIGEIGMDSVWCNVSLKQQKKVLEQQLQLAADMGKPILLHTKGQEEMIGQMIRDFPGNICVHWYSGSEQALEAYLEKDCYFTLGPDFAEVCQMNERPLIQMKDDDKAGKRQGYLRILKEIPEARLFVETDGISAAAWAKGKKELSLMEMTSIFKENIRFVAMQRHISEAELERQMWNNLSGFLDIFETDLPVMNSDAKIRKKEKSLVYEKE